MNTNDQHTPGPWTISVNNRTIEAPGGYIVAENYNHAPGYNSNLHLIAAAPELLEALKLCLARMDENPPAKAKKGDLDATFRVATFYRDREEARRLIQRIEGEASQ